MPVGALRRSSSKKFRRNVRCVSGFFSFALSATNAARRLPPVTSWGHFHEKMPRSGLMSS
jgi:hypothetical protein